MKAKVDEKVIRIERAKSHYNRWCEFERRLRGLQCDVAGTDREDDFALMELQQAVMVFVMKDKFGEKNETFLENTKREFYSAIEELEKKNDGIANSMFYIKLFMEDYYFNQSTDESESD